MDTRTDQLQIESAFPGLLWAHAGSAGEPTILVEADDLLRARAEHDWVWIHVDLLDQRVHGWIADLCGLSSEVVDMLVSGDSGLSFQYLDGELHGLCPDFNTSTARVSNRIGRFSFSASEHILVTGRRQPVESLYRVHQALTKGPAFTSAYGVFGQIINDFCQTAATQLRQAEADLDQVEDRLLESETSDERGALKEVRRLAMALHRPVLTMLTELRELNEDIEDEHRSPAVAAGLRFMEGRLSVLDQTVMHISDRAKLLQEEIAAKIADNSNRSLNTLTVMSVLLMPATLVAGIFGMNTGGLPFETGSWGTYAALFVCGAATVGFYRIVRRAGASL